MPGKMPSGPDFSKPVSPVEKKKRAPKPPNPLLKRKNIDTMATRVMGMREGLELRREALAGEPAPSVEEQMTAHGVVETPAKTSQQEKMIRAANKAAENSIKNGATPAQVEVLKNGLINAITSGDEEGVLSYSRSFNLLNKRNGAVVRSKTESPKKAAEAGAEKPLNVATQMEEHGVVDTTEEAETLLKELALRNKKQKIETPLSEAQQEQMLVDAKKGISDLSLSLHEKTQRIEKTSSHTPDDSITPKEVEKPAKPRKKVAALNMGPFATRNEGPIDAISEEAEAKWTGENPTKPEILGADDPHDPVAQEDIHKWTGEKAPEAKTLDEAAPKAEPAPTPEAAPKPADASIEEKEAALKELAAKSMPKPAPGSAPVPPRTPEEIEGSLNASLVAARNEMVDAEKARKADREHRGLFRRTWNKYTGTVPEAESAYNLAKHKYHLSKVAMGQHKLGTDEYVGPNKAIEFAEKESEEYEKLSTLSPEKKNLAIRMLQGYARMPAYVRIPLSVALSTGAVAGAIAATGGFAGLTAAFLTWRAARTAAGIGLSTLATEGVGKARNNTIDNKQNKEKETLLKGLSGENMGATYARVEKMRAERKTYDKQTAIVKALTAAVVGGTTGAALTEIASHFDAATTASDVFTKGTTPWNPIRYPDMEGVPVVPVENGPNLEPPVQSYDDPMYTPPYPSPTPQAPSLADGFGEQPPFANYFDPNDIPASGRPTVEAAATVEPSANYADNPPTQEGILAPRAPSEPITVTGADAKKGLWGILERKALADGAISEHTPIGDKNALIASMEKDLRALSPEKLQELGFRPSRSGVVSIDVIRPGEKLDLSITDPQNWPELGTRNGNVPAAAPIQADVPTTGIKSDVPLPPTRPNFEVPADVPANDNVPTGSRTEGMPLNIHPDFAPAGSRLASAENIVNTSVVETIEKQAVPQDFALASGLQAKGMISPMDRAVEYNNWNGAKFRFKTIMTNFDDYRLLNRELNTARDTFNINLDGKTVGAVLKELAQKRATSGKVLTA